MSCMLARERYSPASSMVHVVEEPGVPLPDCRQDLADGSRPLEGFVGAAYQVQTAAIRAAEAVDALSVDTFALSLRTYYCPCAHKAIITSPSYPEKCFDYVNDSADYY